MKRVYWMFMGLALALCTGACGGGELDFWGCRTDSDCKHGRKCVEGACQDDTTACTSDDQCPLGQHCYGGNCTVCDADGDQVFGQACAGPDCDDGTAAVHPGATELCGDGLDNDCDGSTDPADLCDARCRDVQCPPGQACDPASGECVLICEPACANKECGPDGCGGQCGTCGAGQICDREQHCVAGCQDRCTAGAQQCVGAQVVNCRDTDNDGCVEWSDPADCPQGQSCADGACAECRPFCDGRECGPDGCGGTCGRCPEGLFCDGGRCAAECWDECWWDERYCLSEKEYVECGQWDEDPCLEFSDLIPCYNGTCNWETGSCEGECSDECVWGDSYCASQREVAECGEFDGDPCLEFGPTRFCESGGCDYTTGRCVGECWDECSWGQSYCMDDFSYSECADWDNDGCAEFGPRQICPDGQPCSPYSGRCSGECWDECGWGESYCWDDWTYQECGDWDQDWCLEFSPPLGCPPDMPCNWNTGRCGGECWDECWWGEIYCWDDMSFVMCEDYNGDGCAEFGPPMMCPPDSWCDPDMGGCAEPCWDECAWGEITCITARRYQACGQYDMDYCAEWGPPERCPQGSVCDEAAGGCVGSCQDECVAGERFCIDTWAYVECGYYDQDACLEFGQPMQCPADAPCDWNTGRCGACDPLSCWDLGVQCGWHYDGCNQEIFCGACAADEICTDWGTCEAGGGRPGAGQPCSQWQACPNDWNAAWTCVEYPAAVDGFCSYPCTSDSDCAADFPEGCCRELEPGYSVCLPDQNLCQFQGAGYLEPCQWAAGQACLPDMYCIEDYMSSSGESICMFTCDRAMGSCPMGGQCMQFDPQSVTGVCMPTGDGSFADPCSLQDGCVSGLVCLPLHEDYPGYCNTMCNSMFPCPGGFDCVLQDGEGGTWCAELCSSQADCDHLGDWECVFAWGDPSVGACLPSPQP